MLRAVALLLVAVLLVGCRGAEQEPEPVVTLPSSPPLRPASTPERLRAQLDLAEGYIEAGDLARARAAIERALEFDSRSWEANDLFGRIYQQQGEAGLAERHFRLALRQDSDNARVHNDYGVFLYQQRRYGDAVEQLRRAVADPDNPQRPVAYENLGLASLAIGDRDQARSAFGRAVMLQARMPVSLIELAELAYDDAEYAQSSDWYRRYREITGRQTPRGLWLGIRLARLAQDADAEASYALQLRNLYPFSDEYRDYRETVADG
jgi:type IV pilus assembly protein PilF